MPREFPRFRTHGDGSFRLTDFAAIGDNVVIEPGVMVFHPENITLGSNVYVGHQTILKAYHRNSMVIGDNSWIGQQCFIHSAGGVSIGRMVGIGPAVRIISSYHRDEGIEVPILASELAFYAVTIEDDCDIGTGAILLPGVRIGRGAQIGAGAVVSRDVPPFSVAAGVPAKVIRSRRKHGE
jgi:acetyltransferase-like isoleucine patch superfamily enzyme